MTTILERSEMHKDFLGKEGIRGKAKVVAEDEKGKGEAEGKSSCNTCIGN